MKFTVIDAPQRSPEWFAARAGRATGSRAADILATIKSGEAAARRDYRIQLVAERLCGEPQEDGYTNADMQRGIDLEPFARLAYEAETGNAAEETGFCRSEEIMAGCSLDGSVDGFTGIVEMKCPRPATHIGYLRSGELPAKYRAQVTHNALITGAKWADFVSYCPMLPKHLELFVVRVEASALDLAGYREQLDKFLAEVDAETESLQNFRR